MKSSKPLSTEFDLLAQRLVRGLDCPLPHDISERLRAARVRAVAQRRVGSVQVQGNGTLVMGGDSSSRLLTWLGSMLPLLALVLGLITIKTFSDERRAQEVADVDTALLTDELPPAAYTDPGFLRFLKTPLPQPSEANTQ